MAEILIAGCRGLRLVDASTGTVRWRSILHELPELDADRREWVRWYGDGVSDEAKPLAGTSRILTTCVAGLVAVVDMAGGAEPIAWEPGAHSAELLPDGHVVVAVSDSPGAYPPGAPRGTPSHLVLHRQGGSAALQRIPLDDAHGVHWDPRTGRLVALGGDRLVSFAFDGGRLTEREAHPLPPEAVIPSGGGHDLVPDPVEGGLLVTTVTGVWRFAEGAFTPLGRFAGRHVKSIAVHPRTGTHAWIEADPARLASGRDIRIGTDGVLRPADPPYKARWADLDADGRFAAGWPQP